MDLSNYKHNQVSSLLSSSHRGEMNSTIPMSQDSPSMISEARVTNEFLGIFTNENEKKWECPYSEIYPIIVPQNEDDHFADNALMNLFKDAPLIQQIRSQKNSQKENQNCNTHKVDSDKSEQFMSEPHSASANTQRTLTPPEIFSHSQPLNNQISSPTNKRQKTSSVNQSNSLNTPDFRHSIRSDDILSGNPREFASNNFNVNQGTSSSVNPTGGCKCIKTSCSKGYCPCFKDKVGCSSKTCECRGCKNCHGRRNESEAQLPNNTVRMMNQRATFHEWPLPTDQLQYHPSPNCLRVYTTQRASFDELPQPSPLQFHPSPCSSIHPTQRTSFDELPQRSPLQFHPSPCSSIHPTQRASFHELPQRSPLQFHPSPCSSIHPTQRASFHELPQRSPLQFHPSPCSSIHPTQRASFHELPQRSPLQFRPSPCSSIHPTQRASFHELPQRSPLQFHPSPCSSIHPTQRASFHELPQRSPLQFRPSPYSAVHPTQRASFHESSQTTPLRFRLSPYPSVEPSELWKIP